MNAACISAAILAISDNLPEVATADVTEVILERFGDALRADVPLPRSVRAWLACRTPEQLATAIGQATDRLADTLLPSSEADERMEICVVARDRLESVQTAALRVLLAQHGHQAFPVWAGMMHEAQELAGAIDAHLATLSLDDVVAALGDRAHFTNRWWLPSS